MTATNQSQPSTTEEDAKKKAKEEAAAKKKAEEEARKKAEQIRTVCRQKCYYNNVLYNPGQAGPVFSGVIPEDAPFFEKA